MSGETRKNALLILWTVISWGLKIFGVIAVIAAFWATTQLVSPTSDRYLYNEYRDIYIFIVGLYFFVPVVAGLLAWGVSSLIDLRIAVARYKDETLKAIREKKFM
ncbi:hypothetical protein ANRL4_04832 [Anaerolineae bacterium]|nr:hypothetical protein ANRL4_04832 [Anaerolineae bacterium]